MHSPFGAGAARAMRSITPVAVATKSTVTQPTKQGAVRAAMRGRRGRGRRLPPDYLPPCVETDDYCVQVVLPQEAALLAGTDFGRKDAVGRYRDYVFDDGYVYRLYRTGDVAIVRSPRKGTYDPPLAVARGSKAWRAIRGAIQAKRSGKRAATADAFTQIAAAASDIATAITGPRSAPAEASYDEDYPEEAPTPAPASAFPWAPVGLGVAALVAILALRG